MGNRNRCKLCKINFGTNGLLREHILSTANHSPKGGCGCDGCAPAFRSLPTNHPTRQFNPRRLPPVVKKCEPCGTVLLLCGAALVHHRRQTTHQQRAQAMNIVCPDTGLAYLSKAEYGKHLAKYHKDSVQYHCIDCSQDFPNKCALKKHPKKKCGQTQKQRPKGVLCAACQKTFPSGAGYDNHLKSKEHKRNLLQTKCLGYPKCPRKFRTKGGMMAHLESGACRSKLDRQKIDEIIRQHDTENVVLKVEYSNNAVPPSITDGSATPRLIHTPSISSYSAPPTYSGVEPVVYDLPTDCTTARLSYYDSLDDDSSDEDLDGGCAIIMTPTTTSPPDFRRASMTSDSALSSSGLITPRSGGFSELDFQLAFGGGKLCHLCGREFRYPAGLQSHLTGLAHAPRIYHCPVFLFAPYAATRNSQRDFKSLSGLVQHLESGACEGGKETLEKALGYVEEKLKGVEIGRFITFAG